MKIEEKLYNYILDRASKRETFSEVIWRLIGQKQISEQDKREMPPEYSDKLNTPKKRRIR